MSCTIKSILRYMLGAILPVPLFVAIFYASYFYKSYNGFDFEDKVYMIGADNLAMSRQYSMVTVRN